MPNSKVVKYKKPFHIDFGKVIFIFVVLYIVFIFFAYVTKEHITIYEVPEAKISDDSTMTGVILRNEKIIKTPFAGYINYYNPAGNRIAVNDLAYTVDGTGQISDLLADVDQTGKITADSIEKMRGVIENYQTNFDESNYEEIYDYQYEIENVVFEQSKESIYADLVNVLKKTGKSQTFHEQYAKQSGIISYTLDGYEALKANNVNATLFAHAGDKGKSQLRGMESVKQGDSVYKVITSPKWTLVVPLSQKYYAALKDKTDILVKIKKDGLSFRMGIQLESRADGYYAILSSSSFINRYLNDRFLEIEIHINAAEGLKIPRSSILKKEFLVIPKAFANYQETSGRTYFTKISYKDNGSKQTEFVENTNPILINNNYYVSKDRLNAGDVLQNPITKVTATISKTGSLDGVYCVNEGSCQFIRIEKVYENAEYSIINPKTEHGLSVYDHIVVNPNQLNENDFIS